MIIYIYILLHQQRRKGILFFITGAERIIQKGIWRHVWMEPSKDLIRTNSDVPKWPTCSINSCTRIDPVSIWVSLVMEYRRRRRRVIDPCEQRNISSWFRYLLLYSLLSVDAAGWWIQWSFVLLPLRASNQYGKREREGRTHIYPRSAWVDPGSRPRHLALLSSLLYYIQFIIVKCLARSNYGKLVVTLLNN